MPRDDPENTVLEGDVVRQAELVVMEYLKSWKCTKTLDAVMSNPRSINLPQSAVASELYAEDLVKKKKAGSLSVLEHMVTTMKSTSEANEVKNGGSDGSSASSSKPARNLSHRRSSGADSGTEDEGNVKWSKEEVSLLKKAIKSTTHVEDKNDRWKQIASLVGNGKSKKHCYLKYKELKEDKGGKSSSRSSSRRSSVDETSDPLKPVVAESKAKEVTREATKSDEKKKQAKEESGFVRSSTSAGLSKPLTTQRSESHEELQMEDCEDFDAVHPSVPRIAAAKGVSADASKARLSSGMGRSEARPPSAEEIESLRDILFPDDRKGFSSHWDEQGLFYSSASKLGYGLIQHEGGPCGVLAVIQAYVLRFMLSTASRDWQHPAVRDQQQALVAAMSHILWQAARASKRTQCLLVLNDPKSSVASSKRKFMSGVVVHSSGSPTQTEAVLMEHIARLMEPKGYGLVLFVLSVLLTKGIDNIRSEMDTVEGALGGGGKLIGNHDYCTQEMVNLLLCGVACSNVFNGKQLLEGTSEDGPKAVVLKGISAQGIVGFLSLFEAYEYIAVGTHLKNPQFNIWVVCSESHYSVLFADPSRLTDRTLDETKDVDLYYYDGLANQDEEIRLSIETKALPKKVKPKADDLIPPLNLVIQTKWPLAKVDWNDVEPLL
ncbi:hypothetical protein Poli38472_004014 [Pythium oligandrum]|uniref:Myb-like domain-containing protein n=1 Tax=Pythium oligandrum TaxID=41045 RepID=A0A8K1CMJ9_PYTOL|nr:hypothetical protein Poli38472_004014 [Pythium oligandrum]|eukprot:TMW66249.1 hypothetical protein Poli38472_004014 [Pythium oligandrum]